MSARREKVIRTPDFAKRMNTACDTNPLIPPINYGRLTWLKTQLMEQFNESVSVETVRKWFAGEAKPRANKIKLLATLLEADEAWLSLGIAPDMTPRERRLRDATADGAVNVLAGLIQMGGGHPAFPEDGDARAQEDFVDLYAIIRGAQYAFHVSLAKAETEGFRFVVPARRGDAMQIGVIPGDDLSVKLVEILDDYIDAGQRKGGSIEVVIPEKVIDRSRIRSFAKRL